VSRPSNLKKHDGGGRDAQVKVEQQAPTFRTFAIEGVTP